MRLNAHESNGAAAGRLIAVAFALAAFFVAAMVASSPARALSVSTPVVGVDVNVGEDGVDVNASVPVINTDVNANVGTGDGGVNVGVDVNSPAGAVDTSVGTGSGSSASGSGAGSGSQGSSGSSNSPSHSGDSATVSGPRSKDPDSPKGQTTTGAEKRAARAKRAARKAAGDSATGQSSTDLVGLKALVVGDLLATPSASRAPDSSSGNESVVAQLVSHIPLWMWIALGLLLLASIAGAVFAFYERRRRQEAMHLAMIDGLTGIANFQAFDDRMDQEWSRASRHGRSLGVMLIDLDRFKAVNDKHGHAAGDEVLIETAKQLSERMRNTDLVARIGGDEFAIVCPETDFAALNGLREELERTLPAAIGFGVGVSIGVAALDHKDERPADLVARADASMYRRKRLRKGSKRGNRKQLHLDVA